MKTKLLLSFLFAYIIVGSASSMDNLALNADKEESIDLQNSLATGSLRCASSLIEVIQMKSAINVFCLSDLGSIHVVIFDDLMRIFYSENINLGYGEWLHIDIVDYPRGNYIIAFLNERGEYIFYREFQVTGFYNLK